MTLAQQAEMNQDDGKMKRVVGNCDGLPETKTHEEDAKL